MTRCAWCGEPIDSPIADHPAWGGTPFHPECAFRAACGSVAHHEARCSCYVPGSLEGDPPGMTKRQAARAAVAAFEARMKRARRVVLN